MNVLFYTVHAGVFASQDASASHIVSVQTSQEETVNSSSYSNGTFYLTLPNPAEGGDYTCSLSSTHHTTACLNLNPSLANGAAVKVDSVLTKFMVLEGRLEALQEENRELNQTDRTLHQQLNMLQAQNANLTSQLQQLRNSCIGGENGIYHVLLAATARSKERKKDRRKRHNIRLHIKLFVYCIHDPLFIQTGMFTNRSRLHTCTFPNFAL